MQLLAADLALAPVMPLVEQLMIEIKKPLARLGADANAFRDGDQIPLDVSPADLALLQRHPAVGAVAITDHQPGKGHTKKLFCDLSQTAEVASWNTASVGATTTHSQPLFPSG